MVTSVSYVCFITNTSSHQNVWKLCCPQFTSQQFYSKGSVIVSVKHRKKTFLGKDIYKNNMVKSRDKKYVVKFKYNVT